MSEDLGDRCEGRACNQQLLGKTPAEAMESFPVKCMPGDTGFLLVLREHTSDADRIGDGCFGSHDPQEYFRAVRSGARIQDIILQGSPGLFYQRDIDRPTSLFLAQPDLALPPVDVGQL